MTASATMNGVVPAATVTMTGSDKLSAIGALLSKLIGHGQAHLAAPMTGQRSGLDELAMLAAELDVAARLMVEGGNPLSGGADVQLLIDALNCRRREHEQVRLAKWDLVIAGAVLLVRDRLGLVLAQRAQLGKPSSEAAR